MIRDLLKRIVAIVGALALLLNSSGEVFGVDLCPYHESGGHQSSSRAEHADVVECGQDEHCGHHDDHEQSGARDPDAHPHGAQSTQAASETTHGSGHGGETCPHTGNCHVPAATPADEPLATTIVWYAGVVRLSVVARHTEASPAFHPPFFLPYSLAPPPLG